MDQRLVEAARTGNVGGFLQLLRQNSDLLEDVAVTTAETPLHIAAKFGCVDMVKLILSMKPGFAQELNQDGFSPLHLATANGHLIIVKELLKLNRSFCFLKDRDGRIPLHCAAIKGRVDILRELLCDCLESVPEVTPRGETALHLAVVNNQAQAVRFLLEGLKLTNKEELVNWKDREGNTLLHLATSRKQLQTLELLLDGNTITTGVVEINAMNAGGFTALDILDVLPRNQSERSDMDIEEILRRARALRARDVMSKALRTDHHQVLVDCATTVEPSLPLVLPNKLQETKKDLPRDERNALLVVATLIATVAFTAGLNSTGGFWQYDQNNSCIILKEQSKPESIISLPPISIRLFLFFNSAAFFASLTMIILLIYGFPLRLWLLISVFSMVGSYVCSIATISSSEVLDALILAIPFLTVTAARHVFHYRGWGMLKQWKYFFKVLGT